VPEPETVKNRLHLDLISGTFDAETECLLGLGAQRLRDVQRDKSRWTTFADIEGNEFDLIAGYPAGPGSSSSTCSPSTRPAGLNAPLGVSS
jgi:hypothetical protein